MLLLVKWGPHTDKPWDWRPQPSSPSGTSSEDTHPGRARTSWGCTQDQRESLGSMTLHAGLRSHVAFFNPELSSSYWVPPTWHMPALSQGTQCVKAQSWQDTRVGRTAFRCPIRLLPTHSWFILKSYCSVTQSCPTVCDPMDCSTPGFPVLPHLPEPAQAHVY